MWVRRLGSDRRAGVGFWRGRVDVGEGDTPVAYFIVASHSLAYLVLELVLFLERFSSSWHVLYCS